MEKTSNAEKYHINRKIERLIESCTKIWRERKIDERTDKIPPFLLIITTAGATAAWTPASPGGSVGNAVSGSAVGLSGTTRN